MQKKKPIFKLNNHWHEVATGQGWSKMKTRNGYHDIQHSKEWWDFWYFPCAISLLFRFASSWQVYIVIVNFHILQTPDSTEFSSVAETSATTCSLQVKDVIPIWSFFDKWYHFLMEVHAEKTSLFMSIFKYISELAQPTVLSSCQLRIFWHKKTNRLGSAGPSKESAVMTVCLGEEWFGHEVQTAHTASHQTGGNATLWQRLCPVLKYSALCYSKQAWIVSKRQEVQILDRSQKIRGSWPSTFLFFPGNCRATMCHNCLQMLGLFSLPVHCVKRLTCFDLQFARGLQLPWEKQHTVHRFRSAQVEEMETAEFYCSLQEKWCS